MVLILGVISFILFEFATMHFGAEDPVLYAGKIFISRLDP